MKRHRPTGEVNLSNKRVHEAHSALQRALSENIIPRNKTPQQDEDEKIRKKLFFLEVPSKGMLEKRSKTKDS